LAYPQISLKQVRETPVPLPVFGEQQAIAQTLSDMDKELETLQTRLSKTKAIKQGMMQELLTGKTRLI
jgi:type I restriction enzyme S subunit